MKFTKSGTRIFASASTIRRYVASGKIMPNMVPKKVKGGYIAVRKSKKKKKGRKK